MREAAIQRAIVDYCRAVLTPNARVFAIPNASRRTSGGFASNGVPGLMKGVPDLCILHPRATIWAEIKNEKGALTPEQRDFIQHVNTFSRNHGCVWRSVDDARKTFAALCIETREAS